jgi:iron complex transport system substrate-binding protein
MKRLVVACTLLIAACGLARALTFTDDAGRKHALTGPAQRVITLAPNLTEMVFAVGGGAQLVGTVATSDHPEAARAVPRVGDHQRLDIERIVALRPDVVLVWHHGNAGRELAQLEAAGLRLVYLEPQRLDEIARAIERVGTLLGREDAATQKALALTSALAALRATHVADEPVRVFYQVWQQPLMTVNDRQLVSDVIRLCGGRNVFGDLAQLVPQLSTESVVAEQPEVIMAARETGPEAAAGGARREPGHPAFAMWSGFTQMPAVKHRWLYTLPGDVISRQGPRIDQGARALCQALDEVRAERAQKRSRGTLH